MRGILLGDASRLGGCDRSLVVMIRPCQHPFFFTKEKGVAYPKKKLRDEGAQLGRGSGSIPDGRINKKV